jgi:hypothetical protein
MAIGKYSPTVSAAYAKNQNWWKPATPNGLYDADGFDSYGYNHEGYDRAAVHEDEYSFGVEVGDEYIYDTYEIVLENWTVGADGQPVHKSDLSRVSGG